MRQWSEVQPLRSEWKDGKTNSGSDLFHLSQTCFSIVGSTEVPPKEDMRCLDCGEGGI